jgi:diguanylate cyclase (GGDEF)-like protein
MDGGNKYLETFQQSVSDLDRSLVVTWRRTLVQIFTAIVAIVVCFLPADILHASRLQGRYIVSGLLALLLISFAFEFVWCRQTKLIRQRLAEQLQLAIEQRVRADQLYSLSILDPLTGLHNRRFGEARLQDEISRSNRDGDALAVLLFDLDYFKEINDQFGHAAGDAALKAFSNRVKTAIRTGDIPVRIGGDEFLVILPDCPREKVDEILSRIGSPEFRFNRQVMKVRYSIGRAHYQPTDTIQTILARADESLYAAKASRKKPSRADAKPEQVATRKTDSADPEIARIADLVTENEVSFVLNSGQFYTAADAAVISSDEAY